MTATGHGADAVLSPRQATGAATETAEPPVAAKAGTAPEALVVALIVAAALALAYGSLLRLWLLVQLPIWGDEAIVGLMARAIDGGHFTAFYWGQHYGGLEPYLVALGLKAGGGGEPAMNAVPALLSAVAAALVGGLTFAAGRSRALALAAAGAVWVWPYVVVWQSVREGGFREATLCCGVAALLCCVRAYRRSAGRGTFVVLGLALGLGWWASPEIAYFALPCLVLLAAWWAVAHPARPGTPTGVREPSRRVAVALVAGGGLVGSLPWWYANAHTGFASVQRGSLPANGGATYGERLSVFFHFMLPLQLGVRTVLSGSWVGGPTAGKLLYGILLALIAAAAVRAVWIVWRHHATLVPLALAVGVVAYPFLYAAAPGTAYWNDGRYGIYLPTLVVALFATVLASLGVRGRGTTEESVRARPHVLATVLATAGVLGALCLTVAGARTAGVPADFFTSWHNGDTPMDQVVNALRSHHVTDAYGDYWTAYDLDFLSGGSPTVSPSPLDVSRSTAIAAQVASAQHPAWLFFAPDEVARASSVFANPQPGPGPYTEQTFEAHLTGLGIPYKVVKLGILDAVVPARRLSFP